jgi:hypothetical protein
MAQGIWFKTNPFPQIIWIRLFLEALSSAARAMKAMEARGNPRTPPECGYVFLKENAS